LQIPTIVSAPPATTEITVAKNDREEEVIESDDETVAYQKKPLVGYHHVVEIANQC